MASYPCPPRGQRRSSPVLAVRETRDATLFFEITQDRELQAVPQNSVASPVSCPAAQIWAGRATAPERTGLVPRTDTEFRLAGPPSVNNPLFSNQLSAGSLLARELPWDGCDSARRGTSSVWRCGGPGGCITARIDMAKCG
jgi:hypothetical protein